MFSRLSSKSTNDSRRSKVVNVQHMYVSVLSPSGTAHEYFKSTSAIVSLHAPVKTFVTYHVSGKALSNPPPLFLFVSHRQAIVIVSSGQKMCFCVAHLLSRPVPCSVCVSSSSALNASTLSPHYLHIGYLLVQGALSDNNRYMEQ